MMLTHGEGPTAQNVPPEHKNDVLRARMVIGNTAIMGADVPPACFQPMRSAYLSLHVDGIEEAEHICALLPEGG